MTRPDSEHSSGSRMVGLDGLRFLAAFGVLITHYAPCWHPQLANLSNISGPFCVKVFFIISGIVIMQTARKTTSAVEFLYRRFIRLYPTFFICLVIDTLITVRFVHNFSLLEIVENLTMLPWLLRATQVNGVFWTLSN
ncbi:MAG: hypothetical protein B7Z81_01305, partial [Acidocella sp. 20-61-6]